MQLVDNMMALVPAGTEVRMRPHPRGGWLCEILAGPTHLVVYDHATLVIEVARAPYAWAARLLPRSALAAVLLDVRARLEEECAERAAWRAAADPELYWLQRRGA